MTFPGPAGVLEGLWADPGAGSSAASAATPAPGTGPAAAVICHPHPARGGSMHSKVVHALYRVLDEVGHATLRFNFRGVGRSAGRHSASGEEVADVGAAAAYARARSGARPLWAAGFSFGAWAALRWALEDRAVARLIAVGLPVDKFSFEFLTALPAPLLIVQGEGDPYGSLAGIEALASRLRTLAPVDVRVVARADHFFTGRILALADALRAGLDLPPGSAR